MPARPGADRCISVITISNTLNLMITCSVLLIPTVALCALSSSSRLTMRRTRFTTLDDHAVTVIGSRLWNCLPHDVTSSLTRIYHRRSVQSVTVSVVCNVRAPYSVGWNFRQFFFAVWYHGHPLPATENFTEIVPGEPLRRGFKPKRGSQI